MTLAFAVTVLILSLLAWIGQLLSAVAPGLAARWGLTEVEAEVDPTLLADIRAECLWDALTLWTLPLAATLLILGDPRWTIFGLLGGGVYVYFAGRGIFQRLTMRRRGISMGNESTVAMFHLVLVLWGAAGLAMIAMAYRDLSGALDLWR